jgi:hypothetical protein
LTNGSTLDLISEKLFSRSRRITWTQRHRNYDEICQNGTKEFEENKKSVGQFVGKYITFVLQS